MSGCVVDASALVFAVANKGDGGGVLRRRLGAAQCHAPHSVDAEVGNVLRRHTLSGKLDADEAATALHVAGLLIAQRHPIAGRVSEVAWTMRDNVTFYDACYVAVAAITGYPLITYDAHLGRAPNLPCKVEVLEA